MAMSLFASLSSWSLSRERMLNECPRKFHYHYVASRGGHRPGGPPGSREAWLAKQLTTVPIEIGSLVHKAISNIWWKRLGDADVDIEEETARAQCAFLTSVLDSEDPDPSGGCVKRFLNDVFGPPLDLKSVQAADRSIEIMMSKFSKVALVRSLLSDPNPIMTRYLDSDQPQISHCLGLPAWLKTDLVFRQPNGVDIVEWKTGLPSPAHATQGQVYDLFVRKSELLGDAALVRIHLVYLKSGEVDTRQFTSAERALALRRTREGYERIAALFAAQTAACLSPDRFPPHPGRHCFGCNFQGLCAQSATKASAPAAAKPVVVEDDF